MTATKTMRGKRNRMMVGLVEAGEMLGLSRTHTYNLNRDNRFPVKVHTIAGRYRVAIADIERFLGLDPDASVHRDDTPAATSTGGAGIRQAIRCKPDGTPIDPERTYRCNGQRVLGADLIAGTW